MALNEEKSYFHRAFFGAPVLESFKAWGISKIGLNGTFVMVNRCDSVLSYDNTSRFYTYGGFTKLQD